MKKIFALLALTSFSGSLTICNAYAGDSNNGFYGILDTSLRYINNTNSTNHGETRLREGTVSWSRLGYHGSEDLGGGLKAIYKLEAGLNLFDGTLQDKSRFFNRAAFAGLSGQAGTLTFGRRDSITYDAITPFDEFGVANYPEDVFFSNSYTSRYDNNVRYEWKNKLVAINLGTALVSQNQGRTYGGSIKFNIGPVSLGSSYETEQTNAVVGTRDNKYWMMGTAYRGSNWSVMSYYLNSVYHGKYSDLPNVYQERKDSTFALGANINFTPKFNLAGQFYNDRITLSGKNGHHNSIMAVLTYAFSNHFSIYGSADYSAAHDAALVDLNDHNLFSKGKLNHNRTGIAAGLTYSF